MKIKYLSLALLASISINAHSATEINEQYFGPTYGSATADLLIAKPLQLAGAVAGTALHVVGLPFSAASDSVDSSYEVLVRQPWDKLRRGTGYSDAYDTHIKNQYISPNEVRFVVDRPSEIIINTDQSVQVNPY
ncbi:MAG: hypothetical protein Q3971_07600 [Moraxella sp.]|nr:hypothetical protein [Moraxella sp.]